MTQFVNYDNIKQYVEESIRGPGKLGPVLSTEGELKDQISPKEKLGYHNTVEF